MPTLIFITNIYLYFLISAGTGFVLAVQRDRRSNKLGLGDIGTSSYILMVTRLITQLGLTWLLDKLLGLHPFGYTGIFNYNDYIIGSILAILFISVVAFLIEVLIKTELTLRHQRKQGKNAEQTQDR